MVCVINRHSGFDILCAYYTSSLEMAKLDDLLQIATGLRQSPPLGFKKKITVPFLHDLAELPGASACIYIIYIPILVIV